MFELWVFAKRDKAVFYLPWYSCMYFIHGPSEPSSVDLYTASCKKQSNSMNAG